MESTSISDVRRMCQRGAFRAYVQGSKVFLEDTATGQVVPLNGESGPANTERRAVPHREDRRGSRVERMFGARDTWKSGDPDADQGPYKGFLMVQCEECGAIKAFCAKHETFGYKCSECGHETPLEKLRPLFIHRDYCGCVWGDVRMNCDSEQLRALALFAGEEKAGCYVDSTEGEYILVRGGNWSDGGSAGVFNSNLSYPRSSASGSLGGRSAYFKKH